MQETDLERIGLKKCRMCGGAIFKEQKLCGACECKEIQDVLKWAVEVECGNAMSR